MKYLYLLSACVLLFCAQDTSFAQSQTWTSLKGPNGLSIRAVVARSKVILAATNRGVYRNVPPSTAWVRSNVGMTPDTVLYSMIMTSNGHVFAGADSSIYKSIDTGKHWERLPLNYYVSPQDGPVFGFVTLAPNILIADAMSLLGLFSTTDEGEHWDTINFSPSDKRRDAIACDSNGIVYSSYASALTGVHYEDTLEHNNIVPFNPFIEYDNINCLAVNRNTNLFAGTENGKVLEFSSQQVVWFDRNSPGNDSAVWDLLVTPDNELFAATLGGIYYSADEGIHWILSGLLNKPVLSLAMDENGYLYAGTSGLGIYKCDKQFVQSQSVRKPSEASSLSVNNPIERGRDIQISYSTQADGMVSLKLYDLQGRAVQTFFEGFNPSGNYHLTVNSKALPSGAYFIRLESPNTTESKIVVVTK